MKKGIIVSSILHGIVFFAVLLMPRSSSRWDRVDAIPVDLVAAVASTKSIAPPAPAQETPPPPEPKPEVKEPPKKETPAPKPKRTQSRKFQRIGSTPSDEKTLEERLKERFENIDTEETSEDTAEEVAETPAQTPSTPSTGVTNIATVEATDFPYAWYLNLLRTKITEAWDPPAGRLMAGRANQVIIKFFLARDGTASELEIDVVSGAPGLESSARRALQRAQPFPPLPQGYPEDSVVIAVRFTVSERAR
jgi:periplasmic protein TonB